MGCASVPSTSIYASEGYMVKEIQDAVRDHYAARAIQMANNTGCGCGPGCCATEAGGSDCCGSDCCAGAYRRGELASIGLDATASLGCGNPTALAELKPGERGPGLGSGAGLHVLPSARRGGP